MSTWTTPVTWANGAVTAASMNTEIRDHLNFLKGALDLLTASTTADTGTATYVDVRRAASTDAAFRSGVSGAANPEFQIDRNGKLWWGAGGASALDLNITRAGSSTWRAVGGSFRVDRSDTPTNTVFFAGNVNGSTDTNDVVRLSVDGSGDGRIQFGDGAGTYRAISINDSQEFYVGASGSAIAGGALWMTSTAVFDFYYTSNARIQMSPFNNRINLYPADSASYIQRDAANVVASGGRFKGADGLVTKTVAGTVSDGSFTYGAESGQLGVDTTNEGLYVRSGSTWRAADLRGGLSYIGPFSITNLAASATVNLGYGVLGDTNAGTGALRACFSGDVVGIAVRGGANITAGGTTAAVFKPLLSGSAGTLSTTLDSTTNTLTNHATQGLGIDTFTASTSLGVTVTTSSTFAPTTTEYSVWLVLAARRF